MNRTFNNGIGMVAVVPAEQAQACMATLRESGEQVYQVGHIQVRGSDAAVVLR